MYYDPDYVDPQLGPERKANMWYIAPLVDSPQTVHIILEGFDMAVPHLTSYARYIIKVLPVEK